VSWKNSEIGINKFRDRVAEAYKYEAIENLSLPGLAFFGVDRGNPELAFG
jgi:hypothetical protein